MSLLVPTSVLTRIKQGEAIKDKEFISIIEESLPKGSSIIISLCERKKSGEKGLLLDSPDHMDTETRGQLLRIMASSSIRSAIENQYGVQLGFRNCHASGVIGKDEDKAEFEKFFSVHEQLKAQSPEFVDC